MEWVYNDGGRAAAGYKGTTGDCVCRAIAIVTEKPYQEIYDLINEFAKSERTGKRKSGKSNARTGVYIQTIRKVMAYLGYEWTPTMKIGQGCTVHLTADELPSGRLVVSISGHEVAVINGVIHDTYNSSIKQYYDDDNNLITNDRRCVYGYYIKKQTEQPKDGGTVASPLQKSEIIKVNTKWDSETIIEFAKRLKEHYPHTISICNTIDKEMKKMLEENGV